MKRSPLKRKTPLRSVSKMKHRRDKRFIPKEVIIALRERSKGVCEFHDWQIIGDGYSYVRCSNEAVDPHHVKARSQGGKHTLNNLKHVCRSCHRFTLEFPKISKEKGWIE